MHSTEQSAFKTLADFSVAIWVQRSRTFAEGSHDDSNLACQLSFDRPSPFDLAAAKREVGASSDRFR